MQTERIKTDSPDFGKIILIVFTVLTVLMAIFTLPDYIFAYRYIFQFDQVGDLAKYFFGATMISHGNMHIFERAEFLKFFEGYPLIQRTFPELTSPPLVYIGFSWFAGLGMSRLNRIFYGVNHILILISVFLIFQSTVRRAEGPVKPWIRLIIYEIFALFFSATIHNLLQGQINIFIFLLFSGSLYLFSRGKDIPGGVLVGLATAMKIFPGFGSLPLIPFRRYRALIAMVLSAVLIYCLIYMFYGGNIIMEYRARNQGVYAGFIGDDNLSNQSIYSFSRRIFSETGLNRPIIKLPGVAMPVTLLLILLNTALLFMVLARNGKNPGKTLLAFPLSIHYFFLISPLVWDYYFIFLITTAIMTVEEYLADPSSDRSLFLLSMAVLLCIFPVGAFDGFITQITRPTAWAVRFWCMQNLIPQTAVLILFWLQAGIILKRSASPIDKHS